MKSFVAVLLSAIIVAASAAPSADQETIKASAEKVKHAHEVCNEHASTHIEIPKKGEGKHEEKHGEHHEEHHEEPANLGPHLLCVSKNLGWQHADGSVDEAVVRARATALLGDNPKYEEIIVEAVKPQATPEETAKRLFSFYRKYAPRSSDPHHGH